MSEVVEKKNQKETKRKRNMRNTVMMAVLSVLLLSGATYAWFTLSSTAKVSNITLTVGEASGLQISDEDGTGACKNDWQANLQLGSISDNKVRLLPATMLQASLGTWYKPTYNDDGNVSGVTSLDMSDDIMSYEAIKTYSGGSNTTKNVYCITKTFYLKTQQGSTTDTFNIYLTRGTTSNGSGLSGYGYVANAKVTDGYKGTYVFCTSKSQTVTSNDNYYGGVVASNAIRVYFENETLTDTSNLTATVFQPNSDSDTDATNVKMSGTSKATVEESAYGDVATVNVSQKMDGTFTTNPTDMSNSEAVFKILGSGIPNKITMTIWLEGSDPQCVNEVGLDDLLAQIQFTLGDTVTTQASN